MRGREMRAQRAVVSVSTRQGTSSGLVQNLTQPGLVTHRTPCVAFWETLRANRSAIYVSRSEKSHICNDCRSKSLTNFTRD